MPVILIQDFSGAGLSSRLQPNNDALWWREKNTHQQPNTSIVLPEVNSIVDLFLVS